MNYEIKNGSIKASINSFGAQLNSLKKIDKDLEYIWQADPIHWNRHSPILFPIVGRLKGDIYIYENETYNMTQHGFARDCEFELTKEDENYLKFCLKDTEESFKTYPFKFELFVSYELIDNRLLISYDVNNMSDGEMFFSIGAHPAFNWPLDNEGKEDSYLEFINIKSTKRYFLNDKGLVYKSANLEIEDNKIALNDELFKEDALVFNDANIKQVTFKNLENKNYVKLDFENFPYLGLWSKPSGAPFICIEPWFGIADEQNSNQKLEDKKGMITLQKDESFSCFYSIEI